MPLAVLRAETFYRPPSNQPADAWANVPAAELVWRWVEYRMQRRAVPPEETVDETNYARIDQNRWVADCTSCGSAQVVSPTDPRAACTECQWGWWALIFPEDVAAVEASLLPLKPGLRNWWHPEDPSNPVYIAEPPPEPGPLSEAS